MWWGTNSWEIPHEVGWIPLFFSRKKVSKKYPLDTRGFYLEQKYPKDSHSLRLTFKVTPKYLKKTNDLWGANTPKIPKIVVKDHPWKDHPKMTHLQVNQTLSTKTLGILWHFSDVTPAKCWVHMGDLRQIHPASALWWNHKVTNRPIPIVHRSNDDNSHMGVNAKIGVGPQNGWWK